MEKNEGKKGHRNKGLWAKHLKNKETKKTAKLLM
jgi:hypothetical protein